MIRGPSQWEQRYRWPDTGLPEEPAYKLRLFVASGHLGLRVDVPRIPGLAYPSWQDLQAP